MTRRAPKEYTPEQEIATRVAKGEITHRQATHLRKAIRKEEEAHANRSVLRRVLDFMTP